MILYHGSNIKIFEIDLTKSKPGKDFGKGLYLSDNEQQALEFANYKSLQLGGEPSISKFIFNKEELLKSNLDFIQFDGYSENWLDFVIANRTGLPVKSYDFVFGPIADDKVGRQLRRFFDKDIDKKELIERLKYYKGITFQYYFGSEEALKYLQLI